MKKTLKAWQLAGFIFTGVFGVILHFAYEWSESSILLAPFSAVNESIFEHMKLLFFPMFVFSLIEQRFIGEKYKNFWCAKLRGIASGLILIPVLYYSYTGVLGVTADWFNIVIFFIATAVSYITETTFLNKGKACLFSSNAAFAVLCALAVVFIFLTFFPIKIPLFKDPVTGLYGRL